MCAPISELPSNISIMVITLITSLLDICFISCLFSPLSLLLLFSFCHFYFLFLKISFSLFCYFLFSLSCSLPFLIRLMSWCNWFNFSLLLPFTGNTMAPILDGNAHARSNLCYLICLRRLIRRSSAKNWVFFLQCSNLVKPSKGSRGIHSYIDIMTLPPTLAVNPTEQNNKVKMISLASIMIYFFAH